MTDTLYQYLLEHSLREPEHMQQLREKTAALPERIMQIAPEQAQFMQLLLRLMRARRGIEIGTFTGYSALALASALPKDGKLHCCDLSEEWMQIGKPFWRRAGVEEKIEFHQGPALQTLHDMLCKHGERHFDFAFIDADKENYQHYYERCLRLVRPGGVIMVDNTLWDGTVCDPGNQEPSTQAIRAFNQTIVNDARVHLSQLPIADGLTLALLK